MEVQLVVIIILVSIIFLGTALAIFFSVLKPKHASERVYLQDMGITGPPLYNNFSKETTREQFLAWIQFNLKESPAMKQLIGTRS